MVEITPNTQKGILLRIVLLLITNEINSIATSFTQDPNNNVFKQAQPLNFSLKIFLLPIVAELCIFLFANAYSERHYGSAGMWSRTCLFAFVIGVCPAVCVMEHHRMSEVIYFYGKWLCVYDYVPEDSQESMRECPVGKNRTVTCVRVREINECYDVSWKIHTGYSLPKKFWVNGEELTRTFNGFYIKQGDFQEYPKLTGKFICNPPPHARIENKEGEFKGCNVKNYAERLDQNNFWTFTCFLNQKAPGHLIKPSPPSSKLCLAVKQVCSSKNLTNIYHSMKMQCRLTDMYFILSVTIACWILPNYVLKSGKLPTLLLTNILTAADTFDLLNCFDEPLAPIPDIWRTVIYVWPASLIHLLCNNISTFADTSTEAESGLDDSESHSSRSGYSGSDSSGSDSGSWSEYVEETNNQHFLLRGSTNIASFQSNSSPSEERITCPFSVIVGGGVLEILLSIVLQDLPFLWWRCYLLSRVNRYNTQIYFFAAKNVLFIILQVFRASVLLHQRLRCM